MANNTRSRVSNIGNNGLNEPALVDESQISEAQPPKAFDFQRLPERCHPRGGQDLWPPPLVRSVERTRKVPADVPAHYAHLWAVPLLSREEELRTFRQLRSLKQQIEYIRGELRSCRGCVSMLDEIAKLGDQLLRTRNFLVESNMRLVVSVAKQFLGRTWLSLDELLSVGNLALLSAVEQFDDARGFRFSTYAYKAVERAIFGLLRAEQRQRLRFTQDATSTADCLCDAGSEQQAEIIAMETEAEVSRLLTALTPREQEIVKSRFGFAKDARPLSFQKIGERLGLSKQRVGTIFGRSLEKMRKAAAQLQLQHLAQQVRQAS